MSSATQEDKEWRVGGRYEVITSSCLWQKVENRTTQGKQGPMPVGTVVVLAVLEQTDGIKAGYFVAPNPFPGGWLLLESDANYKKKKRGFCGCCFGKKFGAKSGKAGKQAGTQGAEIPTLCLRKKALPSSLQLHGLYKVLSKATLRDSPEMDSSVLGELHTGEEAHILDFGANSPGSGQYRRLRALVTTLDGKFGWMSCETKEGAKDIPMLSDVDLLSCRIADVHKSMIAEDPGKATRTLRGGLNALLEKQGIPWHVQGVYRTLESEPLRPKKDEPDKFTERVPAGSLIRIFELHTTSDKDNGDEILARVEVRDGEFRGNTGWLSLASSKEHDMVDVRNQADYHAEGEKVLSSGLAQSSVRTMSLLKARQFSFAEIMEVSTAVQRRSAIVLVEKEQSELRTEKATVRFEEENIKQLQEEQAKSKQLKGELETLREEMDRLKKDMMMDSASKTIPPVQGIEEKAKKHEFVMEGDQWGGFCCTK